MGYLIQQPRIKPTVVQSSRRQKKWIHDLYPNNYWDGKSCVILGGGESINRLSTLSFLLNHKTIAINKSFMLWQTDMVYAMDTRFYHWLMSGTLDKHEAKTIKTMWNTSSSVKVLLDPKDSPVTNFGKEIHFVKRLNDPEVSKSISSGIHSANNSMFGGLMLAIAMGANPVYLLGCDLKIDMLTHWHKGYPGQEIEELRQRLGSFKRSFEEMAPKIKEAGIEVYNLNSDSDLKCFDFKSPYSI